MLARTTAALLALAALALVALGCGGETLTTTYGEVGGKTTTGKPSTVPTQSTTTTTSEPTTTTTTTGGGGGGAAAGKTVFDQSGCGSCHTFAAAGASGTVGPNLDDAIPNLSMSEIRQSIVNPDAKITKGYSAGIMPSNFGQTLSKQQLNDLIDFLQQNAGS